MKCFQSALGLVVLCLALDSSLQQQVVPTPLNLTIIGPIEGVTYFAEVQKPMSWEAAATFCKSGNLKLASVKTANQSAALSARLFTMFRNKNFWTSAREARTRSALVWDESRQPVGNGFALAMRMQTGYYYCGTVSGQPTNPLLMSMTFCLNSYNVLCEMDGIWF